MRKFERGVNLSLAGLCVVMFATATRGQVPEEFTNLQLLDPATSKGELVDIMKDWAGGLGVRCEHCHVGDGDLASMDFASDEKPEKRTARRMLEMARKLNRDLMKDLPTVADEGRARAQIVSCYTCHRGQPRPPRQLFRVLADVARQEGVDAAIGRNEELREEFLGAGVYDFRPRSLERLAKGYLNRGMLEEARRVVKANLEAHPEATSSWTLLGEIELRDKNAKAAREAFEMALEFSPGDAAAIWGLMAVDELETGEPEI